MRGLSEQRSICERDFSVSGALAATVVYLD
jgi:hypothetical protein